MKTLINDGQNLTGAKSRHGTPLAVYDDGFGPLFIHRDSMGISGIVRARTWEDAYGICEDEFFPEAHETVEELRAAYNFKRDSVKIIKPLNETERPAVASDYPRTVRLAPDGRANWEFVRWKTAETPCKDENGWTENTFFCEAFGFRPNGPRAGKREDGTPKDPIGHGIYAKDLNGDRLDALTPELIAELGITLEIETPDSVKWENTPDGFTDYRLPDCWASALINGDESGLEPSDVEALNAFLEKEKPGQCVECSPESEFSKSNDAGTLAGNVLTFRFQNPSA